VAARLQQRTTAIMRFAVQRGLIELKRLLVQLLQQKDSIALH